MIEEQRRLYRMTMNMVYMIYGGWLGKFTELDYYGTVLRLPGYGG